MSIWGDLQYLPLGQPHFSLLTAIYFVLVAWILVRALRLASTRIGLGSGTALILLAASLCRQLLEHPSGAATPAAHHFRAGDLIFWHVLCRSDGGELAGHGDRSQCWRRSDPGIAVFLSLDQISALASGRARDRDRRICLSSVGAAHSRPRHRAPVFVPPLSAAMVALILSRPHAPALAYIGGSIGCLVGADLLNLGKIQGLGAPVASIGGAGPLMGFFSPALSRCSLPAYSAHPATSMAKLPERRFDPGGDRRQPPAASRHIACR